MLVIKFDSDGDIPGCSIVGSSNATVSDTSITGQASSATIQSTSIVPADTDIIPQDTSAGIVTICSVDVTIDIGNGSGFPGSLGNAVIVNLDNPADKVTGVQLNICDVDDFLTLDGCETTERASLYTCTFTELTNGCCQLLVHSSEPDIVIQEGDGPIIILKYTVLEEAPVGACKDLNPEGAVVLDENLVMLGVESLPGQFCFTPEPESPASIPTLSEWGIIIFMSIIMGLGVVTLFRRKMV